MESGKELQLKEVRSDTGVQREGTGVDRGRKLERVAAEHHRVFRSGGDEGSSVIRSTDDRLESGDGIGGEEVFRTETEGGGQRNMGRRRRGKRRKRSTVSFGKGLRFWGMAKAESTNERSKRRKEKKVR